MSKLRFAFFFQYRQYILKVFILSLTLIGLGFFDMFRFGGGGGGQHQPPMYFHCKRTYHNDILHRDIYNQSVSSNMKKNLHKINDFIDNDVILLGPVSFVQRYTKQMKYTVYSPLLLHRAHITSYGIKLLKL